MGPSLPQGPRLCAACWEPARGAHTLGPAAPGSVGVCTTVVPWSLSTPTEPLHCASPPEPRGSGQSPVPPPAPTILPTCPPQITQAQGSGGASCRACVRRALYSDLSCPGSVSPHTFPHLHLEPQPLPLGPPPPQQKGSSLCSHLHNLGALGFGCTGGLGCTPTCPGHLGTAAEGKQGSYGGTGWPGLEGGSEREGSPPLLLSLAIPTKGRVRNTGRAWLSPKTGPAQGPLLQGGHRTSPLHLHGWGQRMARGRQQATNRHQNPTPQSAPQPPPWRRREYERREVETRGQVTSFPRQ